MLQPFQAWTPPPLGQEPGHPVLTKPARQRGDRGYPENNPALSKVPESGDQVVTPIELKDDGARTSEMRALDWRGAREWGPRPARVASSNNGIVRNAMLELDDATVGGIGAEDAIVSAPRVTLTLVKPRIQDDWPNHLLWHAHEYAVRERLYSEPFPEPDQKTREQMREFSRRAAMTKRTVFPVHAHAALAAVLNTSLDAVKEHRQRVYDQLPRKRW